MTRRAPTKPSQVIEKTLQNQEYFDFRDFLHQRCQLVIQTVGFSSSLLQSKRYLAVLLKSQNKRTSLLESKSMPRVRGFAQRATKKLSANKALPRAI
jgi:hypothetical protein